MIWVNSATISMGDAFGDAVKQTHKVTSQEFTDQEIYNNRKRRTQVPLQICGCFHSLIIYHRISLVFGCVPAGFVTMAEVL